MIIDLFKDDEAYLSIIVQTNDGQTLFDNLVKLKDPEALLIEVDPDNESSFSYKGKSYVILYSWTDEDMPIHRRINFVGLPADLYSVDNEDLLLTNLGEVISFELVHGTIFPKVRFFLKDKL